jgi:2,3-bisphosphoglycerate-independent phosphoglycerate mutase
MGFSISPTTPLVLCILDGFGYSTQVEGNAIAQTPTPTLDYLWSFYPHTLIKAAEEEVGLDFGQPGNSEVGHLSIGSGRVLLQHLSRINLSIAEKSFFSNPALLRAVAQVKTKKSKLHIMGMISATGVHSHLDHMIEMLHLAHEQQVSRVYLHLITDGRDAGPHDAPIFLEKIDQAMSRYKLGKIASLSGRETAMDRNQNWELTQAYYNTLLGFSVTPEKIKPLDLVKRSYDQGKDDEHIPPVLLDPEGIIDEGDAVIFTNFREDRARQITQALVVPTFLGFVREKVISDLVMTTLTQYEQGLPVQVAYPPEDTKECLADVIETAGFAQYHVAESEKTAHVTYFFNGGRETPLAHEVSETVRSYPPAEFAAHPEMSAAQVTDKALEALSRQQFGVMVVNYANTDMIGHTGDFQATCRAVAAVDQEINRLANAVLRSGGCFALTADHGNAELMFDPISGAVSKEHTINPVPFIVAAFAWHVPTARLVKVGSESEASGILADVAPTLLSLCGLSVPEVMTGTPIFKL